jgi:two-component system, NarL family, response regulator NreC
VGSAASVKGTVPDTIRIVLADDHHIMRRGLQMLLDAEPGFEVVAQAGDGPSVLRCVAAAKPDVLVLDLNMPGGSPLETIAGVRKGSPDTRIVVLTMQDQPRLASAVLRAGARAYILKDAADMELVEAIRQVAAGESYVNRQLAGRMAVDRLLAGGWD